MNPQLRIVDVDQHYYEPIDCCTRHLDPKYAKDALRVVVGDDGQPEWRFGDRPLDIERNPRHITIAPGVLEPSLSACDRGEAYMPKLIDGTSPEFTNRDVRLKRMDEWGIDAAASGSPHSSTGA